MTNFGLSDRYVVHDGLDQDERIFYDPLLYEVKRQEHLCKYRINSNFVAKSDRVESSGSKSSFFATGTFVDNTIWIGNGQALTQYILDIASEFFELNDISINNDKTVVISINPRVANASLCISSKPIFIVKGGESHRYLGIFLSMEGLSKPSLVKTHVDVRFFSNMVLRKAVSDKQFSYLVSAVLQPIKGLRSKTMLPKDFLNEALQHPLLYGLKSFEQVQAEFKIATVISFSNAFEILGHFFVHPVLDLQVLGWVLHNPLHHLVKLRVCLLNNFLAGVVKIFINVNVSLPNHVLCAFRGSGHFLMFEILGSPSYFDVVHSLKHFGVAFGNGLITKHEWIIDWKTFWYWKRLSLRGLIPIWFTKIVLNSSNFLCSSDYLHVCKCLHEVWAGELNIYTDGSLSGLGTKDVACGAVAFFFEIGSGMGIRVQDLLSSTLAELQIIALVLECAPLSCSVVLHSDSQAALNACIKVKRHSGVVGNDHADILAHAVVHSGLVFSAEILYKFFVADGQTIFGNACHFICDIYYTICWAIWEAGLGADVLDSSDIQKVDWDCTASVWHLDVHMLAGFISRKSAALQIFLIKMVHRRLLMAVRKRLYNKDYPSVLCLMCDNVEFSDHVFTCLADVIVHFEVVSSYIDL
ncbi:hypothetical protein G9A89_016160 [Geosiphon pyriformis]|nr:hypothetical protein G9A89_016160 [Geosiphon pyriformis]